MQILPAKSNRNAKVFARYRGDRRSYGMRGPTRPAPVARRPPGINVVIMSFTICYSES
jgi:hypothetical protein